MSIAVGISRAALAIALAIPATAALAAAQDTAPPQGAAASSANEAGVATGDEIIVTGTRATGITAAESAAPIKLVGAEAISHVGQPNLNQVLTQLVPSFTAQSFGGDTANLTLSAALRGLNPNETLVLVNGKRRHGTANLQVLSGAFQGGAAPDLDYITPASVDHIEVLEDGASAQYGSDAIAGVINVILKKTAGVNLSATGGQYYAGDGKTYSTSLNYGYVGDRGFVNVTGFYRYHNFSNRGKYDIRIFDPATGAPTSISGSTALATAVTSTPGYPNLNRIVGDARSKFAVGSINAGYDITDGIQAYGFGTVGMRRAESFENYRLPNRVVGSNNVFTAADVGTTQFGARVTAADVGNFKPGTYGTAGALLPRPGGFFPQEALREVDYQATGGLKGNIDGFAWDLSTSYGADKAKIHTLQSINSSLYVDKHNDQSDFYDGFYRASQWTTNLDLTKAIGALGTLAAGAEYKRDGYAIGAGEPNSYYKTGAQSFPGFNPLAAGNHHRHNYALYGDAALTPVENLKIDGAVRYEDYSDFGSKVTWKATGRYDFTPEIAIRGTASTGFRAPTLAEEQYTAVNVSPTSATAQLAANSAGAKVLGIQNLKPEKSKSYSAGVVLRPEPALTITVDAYQIGLRDRIVGSSSLSSSIPQVSSAIATAGVVLEAGLPSFVSAFVNGPNTRTRGVDIVASYNADLGTAGRAVFTLSGAYNKTKITRPGIDPAIVAAARTSLFAPDTYSNLTTVQPKFKIISGANWSIGNFSIIGRETYYSKSIQRQYNDENDYVPAIVKSAFITDLELDYKITPAVTLAVGSNNLFDKRPQVVRFTKDSVSGDSILSGDSLAGGAPFQFGPYNLNGGYWYARVGVSF